MSSFIIVKVSLVLILIIGPPRDSKKKVPFFRFQAVYNLAEKV